MGEKVIETAYVRMLKSRHNAAIKKSLPTVFDGKSDDHIENLSEDVNDLHSKLQPQYQDDSKLFHLASTEATLAEKHEAKKSKIGYSHKPEVKESEKHIDSLIDQHLHDPLISVKVGKAIEERSALHPSIGFDHKNDLQKRYGYVLGRHADSSLSHAEDGHQTRFTESELEHHHKNGFVPYGNGVFRHADAPLWVNANFQHKDGNYYQVRGENSKKMSDMKRTPEYAQMLSDHTKLSNMKLEPGRDFAPISAYTHESSELNRQLIENHMHGAPIQYENRSHAAELSDTINHSDRPGHDFHVYTGLSKRINLKDIMEKHKDKSVVAVHFPAFTSTTLDKNTAEGFAGNKPDAKPYLSRGVHEMLHIKIPSGHKRGLYVDHMSENPGEYEYLMDKSHVVHIPQQEPMYEFKHGNATRHYSGHVLPNGEHDE